MKTLFSLLLFLITFNSTAQWTEIQSHTINGIGGIDLYSVYFLNPDTGYLQGRYRQNNEWINSYFKTIDGGASWNITSIEGGEGDIYFVNDTLGFVGGFPAQKTIDGGLNWTSYDSIPNGDIIQFVDDSNGYLLSATTLFRTNNAGSSWIQLEGTPGLGAIHNMYFINQSIGYLVGMNYQGIGLISKTIDGGISWSQQTVGYHPLRDIYFTDINTGYAVGGGSIEIPHGLSYESTIFKTVDGGANWFEQYSGTLEDLVSVVFTGADTGYAVGGLFGTILNTVNGGAIWTHQASPTLSFLNSVFFVNPDIGYIVGREGEILKTTNGGNSLTVNENVYDDDLSVHPNPASHKVIIEFDNPKGFPFELTIFNNFGINVLLQSSITGEIIEVDLNNFKQGIYYYNLKSNQKVRRYSGKFIRN